VQIRIAAPVDQTRVDREGIALGGVVSGGKGVSRDVVALNGVEVSRLGERTPQRSVPVNLALKLREGLYTLVAGK
jgi:hypothetical protein